jgi:hypothetical protein
MVVLGLAAGQTLAQQPAKEATATLTNSASMQEDTRLLAPLLEEPKGTQDVIAGKKVELRGPLVRPLKAKKLRDVPKALLQLINPFAVPEPKVEFESTHETSTRAWATTVGWHPGASAFPDPMTHESSMGLFTLSGKTRD